MKLVELRKKTEKELKDMEVNLKEKGRDLRFQLAAGKIKNVREIRLTKKSIARVLTVLTEKRNS
ncbi:50S ribosomal protein L29 [Patescibacteria group bacterium]|nr:50S ribosomal protein L29 [Patescibacteria group bacterium]